MTKIDEVILNYFKLIIPHEYDSLEFRYSTNKRIVFIVVHCNTTKKAYKFFGRKGRDLNILKQLEVDMSDMFPFDFYITCQFKVY
jgi:hypothetical protein